MTGRGNPVFPPAIMIWVNFVCTINHIHLMTFRERTSRDKTHFLPKKQKTVLKISPKNQAGWAGGEGVGQVGRIKIFLDCIFVGIYLLVGQGHYRDLNSSTLKILITPPH